jgi:hypothetical protein
MDMLSSVVAADQSQRRPLKMCFDIWLNIMVGIILTDDSQMEDEATTERLLEIQNDIDKAMKSHSTVFLKAILSYLNCEQ